MAESMRQALMGEAQIGTLDNPGSASPLGPTLSMRTGAFLHPLLQAAKDKFPKHNPRGRWLGEMLLGDSPQRTGRVAEGIPKQYFHFNRGSGSNVSPELVDLAGALPIASTLKLAKAAAVPAAMATGAGLLGRAVKSKNYAPASMDDMGAALLGPAMQRQELLDDAMVTYHGSPYQFDALDPTKIGTGEGAQAYGHGAYVAQDPRVGGGYQKSVPYAQIKRKFLEEIPEDAEFDELMDLVDEGHFSPEQERVIRALEADDWLGFDYPSQAISEAYGGYLRNFDPSPELVEAVEGTSGYLYEIDVPDEDIAKMLDWDAPLSDDHLTIFRQLFEKRASDDNLLIRGQAEHALSTMFSGDKTGMNFYHQLAGSNPAGASEILRQAGIPGIKYYDQGSRAANDGTRNMVLFDELAKRARVLKRNDETIAQSISSANTSIKQVPALFKSKLFGEYKGNKNVDLGGGKFDLGSDYLKSQGVQNDVYDPFNRSAEHNKTVLDAAKVTPPDTVTVNNVLNVIQEPSFRANLIQQAKDIIKPGGSVFFQIYEGTGKGVGEKTTKGFQNNKKTIEYLEEIQKVFPDAERRGNVIIGTSSEPSVDEFIGKLLED